MIRCLIICGRPRCGYHPHDVTHRAHTLPASLTIVIIHTQPVSHTPFTSLHDLSIHRLRASPIHRIKVSAVLNNRLCRYRFRSRGFKAGVYYFTSVRAVRCLTLYATVHRGQLHALCAYVTSAWSITRVPTMRVQTIA